MAGTGKSQVIKALTAFFHERNEDYRLLCVAPTGSAAALINGSTYHSMLGINSFEGGSDSITTSAATDLKENLANVDYLFMDEVSMVDCLSLYNISNRMSMGRGNSDAFGGINVIFAGDFAQLPPVAGYTLYKYDPQHMVHTTHSSDTQLAAIGKALWHQCTTVVLLRQNMRQKNLSSEDAKFRTCLEHLRYHSCSKEDIALLKTRIVSRENNRPLLSSPQFHNVSIITRWNAYRDCINELGTANFARETKQTLYRFYARDTWKQADGNAIRSRSKSKATKNPSRKSNRIPAALQNLFWELPHYCTSNHPGMLTLAIGLPVMIKRNVATECGVTNGAEAVVVGWKASPSTSSDEHDTLDIVFVKLLSPPKPIKLSGLEENVIPIAPATVAVSAKLPNGTVRNISRTQIPIIPNFAMTDFNSQGRTRQYNVCDLQNCPSGQSIYTCLSRGSSLEGTAIIQGFDTVKMTKGISGHLRQEFRDFEILDAITKAAYDDVLPATIHGETRGQRIYAYRNWKGESFMPKSMPDPLRWSQKDPFPIEEPDEQPKYMTLDELKKIDELEKNKNNNKPHTTGKPQRPKRTKPIPKAPDMIPAKGSLPLQQFDNSTATSKTTGKRKRETSSSEVVSTKKERLAVSTEVFTPSAGPIGLQWNAETYSCAYDSLFTILKATYDEHTLFAREAIARSSHFTQQLCQGFINVDSQRLPFETLRDNVRQALNATDASVFPITGTRGTNVFHLCRVVLGQSLLSCVWKVECTSCNWSKQPERSQYQILHLTKDLLRSSKGKYKLTTTPITTWLKLACSTYGTNACHTCSQPTRLSIVTDNTPLWLVFSIEQADNIKVKWEQTLSFQSSRYTLVGLVYAGNFHFTCRIVRQNGTIWYHDGMKTKNKCVLEGLFETTSARKLASAPNGRKCILGLYLKALL